MIVQFCGRYDISPGPSLVNLFSPLKAKKPSAPKERGGNFRAGNLGFTNFATTIASGTHEQLLGVVSLGFSPTENNIMNIDWHSHLFPKACSIFLGVRVVN